MHGHHRHKMIRRHAMRRRTESGPPWRGRGRQRDAMIRGFLDENPECAEKLLRYGIDQMRARDFSDEEIRTHFEEMQQCGQFAEVNIDGLLG